MAYNFFFFYMYLRTTQIKHRLENSFGFHTQKSHKKIHQYHSSSECLSKLNSFLMGQDALSLCLQANISIYDLPF